MKTNIVMLVKNRWRLTAQALTSLYQHTAMNEFNLTFIDDASSPSESLHWEGYVDGKSNATILRIEKSHGITGQARNLGVYWSEKYFGRGDYLYLSDNDVYFTDNWLGVMRDMMSHCNVAVLGGGNHPFLKPNGEMGQTLQGHIGCVAGNYTVTTHDAIAGYTHLMRWETWDKYGPHDAHAPGTSQSEDYKFCQDIIKDGGVVGSVFPEVVYACGLTNTSGQPAIGADQMPRYLGIVQQ